MQTPEGDVIVLGLVILVITIGITIGTSLYLRRKHG